MSNTRENLNPVWPIRDAAKLLLDALDQPFRYPGEIEQAMGIVRASLAAPTVAPADERATFESVIAQKWPHLDLLRRTDDDTYRDCVTDWLWQGWIVGRKTT